MLSLIFIFVVLFHSAKAVGVDFQCPLLFNERENILTCKINKTAIKEAHCSSIYRDVMFEWIAKSGKGVGCQSVYNPQQKCTSGEQHEPGSCWCEDSSGEIITYKFSYQANSTSDRGRQFECNLCVLPQKPLDIRMSEGCANISFAFDSKADGHSGDQSNTAAVIGAAVCGAIIVIVIIIIFVIRRKKHHCQLPCWKKRKDNKQCGDIPLKKKNGFINKKAELPDFMKNIEMTTSEVLHTNQQEDTGGFLNGNAKNKDHQLSIPLRASGCT